MFSRAIDSITIPKIAEAISCRHPENSSDYHNYKREYQTLATVPAV